MIRGITRRFQIRYQRKWGQNFLADRAVLARLVDALELAEAERIVEVGPGLGVLTVELAQRTSQVVGIEIDPNCVHALQLTLRSLGNVRIIEGDVLRTAIGRVIDSPYRVIGNIPYNLTGALMVHVLEQPRAASRIDLVVQKEVAERLAAPAGAWSLATLGVRVYGRPEILMTLPPDAFVPPPQVASALLRIVPDASPALPLDQLPAFFRFVTPFFQARRKQLAFAMARGLSVPNAEARARLAVIGIDPARRAETLGLEEWKRLFDKERLNWRLDTIQAR
ncbi:MAG: 16S rRNA (adenine(1518)-N(6)/adenine(1519)-N(6))-dimethyltransferase RsmA [Candidatus Dormibacteraeota bacterium]|nr:16S rRNA (adenine(1518)-N(6)/adenine(1519)-N(6))-dimethyltransferase RsmA [Candidatus Dormibacteraeota bacterium]